MCIFGLIWNTKCDMDQYDVPWYTSYLTHTERQGLIAKWTILSIALIVGITLIYACVIAHRGSKDALDRERTKND